MIIYEFSTWGCYKGEMYAIKAIEVEEKTKIYAGNGCRINKDDIDKLSSRYGYRMYRLDKDPQPYIAAMIMLFEEKVEAREAQLKEAKEGLAKWKALEEVRQNENT